MILKVKIAMKAANLNVANKKSEYLGQIQNTITSLLLLYTITSLMYSYINEEK